MNDALSSIICGCVVSLLVFLGVPLIDEQAALLAVTAIIWLICRIKLKNLVPFMLTNIVVVAIMAYYWTTVKSWETMFLPMFMGIVDMFFVSDLICYLIYRLIKKILKREPLSENAEEAE